MILTLSPVTLRGKNEKPYGVFARGAGLLQVHDDPAGGLVQVERADLLQLGATPWEESAPHTVLSCHSTTVAPYMMGIPCRETLNIP